MLVSSCRYQYAATGRFCRRAGTADPDGARTAGSVFRTAPIPDLHIPESTAANV